VIENVLVEARRCACEACSHVWISISRDLPAVCPGCKSRSWNGPKKIGRPVGPRDTSHALLPKPKRTRMLD